MKPVLRQRSQRTDVVNAALARGYTPFQAGIIAGRLQEPSKVEGLDATLANLDPPFTLPDIDVAARVIADAIVGGKRQILTVVDHDADGSSSGFVLAEALRNYFGVPDAQLKPMVTHRMKEGYGVSDKFVERMLAECEPGALCITADQGSCDEARIARVLKEKQIETVVTDHHGVPDAGPPHSALACVNPIRADSAFPDRAIAGCYVAWLTMCAVRTELMKRGWLPKDAPSLAPLLDVCALGTVADCVDLGNSKNNRALIRHGLRCMNAEHPRPVWWAMRKIARKEGPFTATDIGFTLAPRVNARGRIGDAAESIQLLRTKELGQAATLAALLDQENQRRKSIQDGMLQEALTKAAAQVQEGRAALCIHLPNGHSGVHGITASRIVELYAHPVCCLSPKQGTPGQVSGSLRSVPGVDIRAALVEVGRQHPDCLLSAGGHKGAAGVSLLESSIPLFHDALCRAVEAQADPSKFEPVVWTDGSLGQPASLEVLAALDRLEPYGRGFETPVFTDTFFVKDVRTIGDGSHLRLELVGPWGGAPQKAVWFRAQRPGEPPVCARGERLLFAYTLQRHEFRSQVSVDMHVVSASISANVAAAAA